MATPAPICPNCDYDLRTQVELQHPNYIADGTPIQIHCDDCGHTFTWPRVTPAKPPRLTGMTKRDVLMFILIGILLIIAILLPSFLRLIFA